ncbi:MULTISPECIES: hypothetical protein [unclassified Lysinibacillus]|uniref:hypothetical protein n=1 Tax=unclassified Lysinibacillus TaxID=2636778 RepID=UPI0038220578
MKGNCYSLCKTPVFYNPEENVIFVSSLRIPVEAKLRYSTSKYFSIQQVKRKTACPANIPLSVPIIEHDSNKTHNYYHSEKQIARWFIKKSEYNKALCKGAFPIISLLNFLC